MMYSQKAINNYIAERNLIKKKYGGLIGGALGTGIGALAGNPMLGAKLGSMVGSGVDSLLANSKAKREEKEARKKEAQMANKLSKEAGISVMDNYSTYGVQGVNYNMANGGKLPIANNVTEIVGPSHENGGVPMPQIGVELEGQEVIHGDVVHSKRLKPSQAVTDVIKELTGKDMKGQSYAQVAKKLGKKKGEMEELLENGSPFRRNAAAMMSSTYENALQLLSAEQVQAAEKKGVKDVEYEEVNTEMAYGGKMKSYDLGGLLRNLSTPNSISTSLGNEMLGGSSLSDSLLEGFDFSGKGGKSKLGNLLGNINPADANLGVDILGAAIQGIGNMNAAERMRADYKPQLVDRPKYNYVDTSGQSRTDVLKTQSILGSANKNLSPSIRAAVMSQSAGNVRDSISQINQQELVNIGQYNDAYNNALMRVGAMNSSAINEANQINIQAQNQKNLMRNQASQSLTQGVQNAFRNRELAERDKMANLLEFMKAGDTGIWDRQDPSGEIRRWFTNQAKGRKVKAG